VLISILAEDASPLTTTEKVQILSLCLGAVGFVVSLVLAILKVVEFRRTSNTRAQLHFSLTHELFLRHSELGETIFLNAVMTAMERPCVIENVGIKLSREDGVQTLPLRVFRYGTPADRGNPNSDFFFYSSSPLDMVPVDTPTRRVYACVIAEYEDRLKSACADLRNALHQLKPRVQAAATSNDAAAIAETGKLYDEAKERFVSTYMESTKIEGASYVVDVKCTFRGTGSKDRHLRTISSRVSFKLQAACREQLRAGLHSFAQAVGVAILSDQKTDQTAPMTAPDGVPIVVASE
jgi:hypothetical protein